MWVIFLIGAFIAAVAAMIIMWTGHKIYLSMKRDNRKFDEENYNDDSHGGKVE